MENLVSAAIFKQHAATTLEDEALDRILNATEIELVRRFGPHGPADSTSQTEVKRPRMLATSLWLNRPATAIVTVTERVDETDTVLAGTDYRLVDERELQRLQGGAEGALVWGDEITVVYTPATDSAMRQTVIIDLARIQLAENGGLESERLGDWSAAYGDAKARTAARQQIWKRLSKRRIV